MSGTNSHPATAPTPQPKVHAGVFYLVATGSAKETSLQAVGAAYVADSFDESTLLGLLGGTIVESVTITAFDADPNIDGSTGQNIHTEMGGGTRVFIPTGMSISWSLLETLGTSNLTDINKTVVQGEAHAIVNYTVRDS